MRPVVAYLVILTLILIYSCNNPQTKTHLSEDRDNTDEISILESGYESNSLIDDNSSFLNDSIIIIDRDSYFLSYDSSEVKRTIYMDYRKISDIKKNLHKIDSVFNSNDISIYKDFISPKPFDDTTIFNSFSEIKKTYIEISRLNGDDILFAQGDDPEYTMVNLNDTLISYHNVENWYIRYYKKTEKVGDVFVLDIYNGYTGKTDRTWIKTIDYENGIQIWKNAYQQWNDSITVHYNLMAPLDYAMTLPHLYVSNPMGWDCFYDKIDKIDWEKFFKK